MGVSLEEFKRLKSKVEDIKNKRARAEGAYEEALKSLKALGYESIEEAQAGLTKLRQQASEAEEAYQQEMKSFREKWGDALNL